MQTTQLGKFKRVQTCTGFIALRVTDRFRVVYVVSGAAMLKVTTRMERRKQQRERYLAGEARRPYTHTPTLNLAMTKDDSQGEGPVGVCAKCGPALLRHVPMFKMMIHHGSDLKKRKRGNPDPKRPNSVPY